MSNDTRQLMLILLEECWDRLQAPKIVWRSCDPLMITILRVFKVGSQRLHVFSSSEAVKTDWEEVA